MTLNAAQRKSAAKELASRIFPPSTIANLNWDDLTAAVGSIDDTMDALPAVLNGAQTVKVNFLNRLPEPFKSTSTAQQKAFALMVWAMKETGII